MTWPDQKPSKRMRKTTSEWFMSTLWWANLLDQMSQGQLISGGSVQELYCLKKVLDRNVPEYDDNRPLSVMM